MKESFFSTNRSRTTVWWLSLFTVLSSALAAFSQTPPPNDNYSNSITLTGTDITFSGTLAGATIENDREASTFGNLYYRTPTQSVWWNWTAPTDTVLTLEILNPDGLLTVSSGAEAIAVYSAANGSSSPAGLVLPALGFLPDITRLAPRTLSIPVNGGSNYQMQIIGDSSVNYTIRLLATNPPVIVTQPRSQTVDSNACALFYVVYAGLGQSDFTFQWYFNGTNLPGETAPMLALTNIDSTMVGTYTVAVSNSAGVTMSAAAALATSQPNNPVFLSSAGLAPTNFQYWFNWIPDAFIFSVAGEAGRSYRLQSSSDLTNWVSESDYPMNPYSGTLTSIFYQTNALQTLGVPYFGGQKFFRVVPYMIAKPDVAGCLNNLRQIRIAKMLWQRDYHPYATATPLTADILPYLPHRTMPFCPDDTYYQGFYPDYSINNILAEATCLYSINHFLEDPR